MYIGAGSQRSSVWILSFTITQTHKSVQVAMCPPLAKDASLNTMLAQWAQAEADGMDSSLVSADTVQVKKVVQVATITLSAAGRHCRWEHMRLQHL